MTEQTCRDFLNSLFVGNGEMASLMQSHDWSQTPLGPVEQWTQSLRTTVSIMLSTRHPMFLFWGPELVQFYNDGYRPILGVHKHPQALGQRGKECWAEIWHIIGPQIQGSMIRGEETWHEDQLIPFDRNGYFEEIYFTYSYSPVRDETGGVGGTLVVCTETTQQVLSNRRLQTLRELSANGMKAKTVEAAYQTAISALAVNPYDIPFALFYRVEPNSHIAHLASITGMDKGTEASPVNVNVTPNDVTQDNVTQDDITQNDVWGLAQVYETQQAILVNDLATRFHTLPGGIWDTPPSSAFIMPIAQPGHDNSLAGLLVMGINPRRAFDDSYRGFFDLVASNIATTITNAEAYEAERQRAEALAEIDRTKTIFFSNVSHEFRTPLTLMLAPLEDALASLRDEEKQWDNNGHQHIPSRSLLKEQLQLAQRNGRRLLNLVNILLDFSRIEAGRIQAVYEPTDLATFTAELASTFRSLIERAGMTLVVECPPLLKPVHVDREMWEKIVLNLLSNAFKFTLSGTIAVRLREYQNQVELAIEDTGIGIPSDEIPRLFERFHRIKGAQGRSFEGSGIGLSLVQELVKLHGGTIKVTSQLGQGSCITVSIPTGSAHLPSERIGTPRTLPSTAMGTTPYIEEAWRWLPNKNFELPILDVGFATHSPAPDWVGANSANATPANANSSSQFETYPNGSQRSQNPKFRVLVVDDNADMREYVRRLLEQHYTVETATNGVEALAAVHQERPDLVLTDVMMPWLDGFGLLRELRTDANTRELPIILLSARAGEEARVEGLEAGADDYLIKPFSSRELMARVEASLKMAQIRREAALNEQALRLTTEHAQQQTSAIYDRLTRLLETMSDAFIELDNNWHITYQNAAAEQLIGGKSRIQVLGKTYWDIWNNAVGTEIEHHYRTAMVEQVPVHFEYHYYSPSNTDGCVVDGCVDVWLEIHVYPSQEGLGLFFRDITDRKRSEAQRQHAEEALRRAKAELEIRVAERTSELREANDRLHQELRRREHIEQQLRQSEARYRAIVEDQTELIIRFTPDSTILFVNDAYCRYFGIQQDNITGKSYNPLIYEADQERVAQLVQSMSIENPMLMIENRVIDGLGRVRWTQWMNRMLFDQQGNLVEFQAVGRDITELKQAEQDLRSSQERLQLALEASGDGIWDWNITTGDVYYNPQYFQMLGYEADELPQSFSTWEQLVHPDDMSWVRETLAKHLQDNSVSYRFDCRLRTKSGEWKWIANYGKVVARDEHGNPLRMIGTHRDVNERKHMEAALRQSEERRRLALDLTHIGFWDLSIPSGNLTWNDNHFTLLGLPSGSAQPHYNDWRDRVHPDDIERVEQLFLTSLEMHTIYEAEYRVVHPDGSVHWLMSRGRAIYDEQNQPLRSLGVILDVSDRKQMEASLQASNHRWRSLLDNVQLVVIELNIDGNVEYVNPFYLELTGYQLEDVLGQYWFDSFLTPNQKSNVAFAFREVLEHNFHKHYQNAILTKSGEERMIAWSNTVLRDSLGQAVGTISIGEDITERYKVERMKAEFISVVSHELRTPLTSMQAALSLLSEKIISPASEEGEATIQIATEGTDRLVRLVNDILDLERLESGKVRLEKCLCNVNDLVDTAVAQMQEMAKQAEITLDASPCTFQVEADGDRLLQVLTNLLSNAIKFSLNGSSVRLDVDVVEREKGMKNEGNVDEMLPSTFPAFLCFKVTDHGRGIPADNLESVFDRFHQVDASDSREKGGTGLGLAICRSIVQQHEGEIWAESTMGKGSTFYFTIPMARHHG